MRRMAALFALSLSVALACTGCEGYTTAADVTEATSVTEQAADVSEDDSSSTVFYLGPEGTYTQEACEAFFEGEGAYLPQADVATCVEKLADGECDFAVIPQENTVGGPVPEYLDEVIDHEGLCVVGEVELKISQNLLAKPGTDLSDIRVIYSHKQGIAQGKAWVEKNLPDAEMQEVSSTAEGARMVSESDSSDTAAIGSFAAAQVYGLEVLADNIQLNDANKTRFYVLAQGEGESADNERMAFVAKGTADDLPQLLDSVKAAGLTIVSVHDRPEKTELGRYSYLVECAGGGADAFDVIAKNGDAFTLRYLGSFSVRQP